MLLQIIARFCGCGHVEYHDPSLVFTEADTHLLLNLFSWFLKCLILTKLNLSRFLHI